MLVRPSFRQKYGRLPKKSKKSSFFSINDIDYHLKSCYYNTRKVYKFFILFSLLKKRGCRKRVSLFFISSPYSTTHDSAVLASYSTARDPTALASYSTARDPTDLDRLKTGIKKNRSAYCCLSFFFCCIVYWKMHRTPQRGVLRECDTQIKFTTSGPFNSTFKIESALNGSTLVHIEYGCGVILLVEKQQGLSHSSR